MCSVVAVRNEKRKQIHSQRHNPTRVRLSCTLNKIERKRQNVPNHQANKAQNPYIRKSTHVLFRTYRGVPLVPVLVSTDKPVVSVPICWVAKERREAMAEGLLVLEVEVSPSPDAAESVASPEDPDRLNIFHDLMMSKCLDCTNR
jgi:hypothetical protein